MTRVAVLYFARASKLAKLKGLAESLALGLRAQGAQVDVINGTQSRELKLTGYHYLAVGSDVRSFLKGTLAPEVAPLLGNCGIIVGKRAFAFVPSEVFGSGPTLLKLMKALEHEGIHLRFSDVLAKPADAEYLGRKLKLD